MPNALIGWTGFVGGTLRAQRSFDAVFRSTDIHRLPESDYDTVVCAGAPGLKWWANQQPDEDCAAIERLTSALRPTRIRRLVLISSVDVFDTPVGVDEDSDAHATSPYGQHRRELERFVARSFADHLIVRLPGLVGDGLRKNALYDLAHGQTPKGLAADDYFQFYPTARLCDDIELATKHQLSLVHLVAQPVALGDIAQHAFGRMLPARTEDVGVHYDVRSRHAKLWQQTMPYHVKRRDVLDAVSSYARSVPTRAEGVA